MILTREEQKSVLRMVMESHQGITLSEAKSNQDIREEMRLNLKFYNEVKKGFLNETKSNILEAEGVLASITAVLGSIKDYLTSLKLGKNVIEWVKNFVNKFVEKFKNVVTNYVPGGETILKGAKYVSDASAKLIKWLYDTLSEKGLAKLFAMIRYRTFSPTEEQKECMLLAAQKAYKWIIITLIVAFIIKVLISVGPLLLGAKATLQAGFPLSVAFAPLKTKLVNLGLKGLTDKLYSTASTIMKVGQAKKLEKEIEAEEATAKAGELDNFNEAWNSCPLSGQTDTPFGKDDYYNTEESLRMQKLAGIV